MTARRRPVLGAALMLIGCASTLSSSVPFVFNALRITVRDDLWNLVDLSRHGVETMGLSVEWGMLSAAMGMYLSLLMAWAGIGWWKGRPWAATTTWAYVACGPAVTFTDLIIFIFAGRPCGLLSRLIFFDALGLLLPVALGLWLAARSRWATGPALAATQDAETAPGPSRRPALALLLMVIGAAGATMGVVPFVLSGLRIILGRDPWSAPDLARHGVDGLGLSTEWCMLTSAMCTCLGALMLWAGAGWLKGLRRRPWTRLWTWVYVTCALVVNATDTMIFLFKARPGPTRNLMLAADGVGLLIACLLGVWLLAGRVGRSGKEQKA
ncbi:MAG: hypothetical protein ACE15C_11080 [Phycisphaerae bacterium]